MAQYPAFSFPFFAPGKMAPSSSSILHQPGRYDVFLSFRGEDIRNDFRSHLQEALSRNQILTFIDDNLRRGDNISPSLLTAIEESIISVIIFSENYADSKWCLKELAKILHCREHNGQIVIPVFYGVDPLHIRKQTGNFGLAFDKLKERLDEREMDLNEVRSYLEEAANISGWNSQIIGIIGLQDGLKERKEKTIVEARFVKRWNPGQQAAESKSADKLNIKSNCVSSSQEEKDLL